MPQIEQLPQEWVDEITDLLCLLLELENGRK